MRGGPRNTPRGPGVGNLEGDRVVVNKDGSARFHNDPKNPDRFITVVHGQQVQGSSGAHFIWDGAQRKFHVLDKLPNLLHRSEKDDELAKLTAGPALGTIGGNRFWVDKDANVIVESGSDFMQLSHGDHLNLEDSSKVQHPWYWDANKRLFTEHNPLDELRAKGKFEDETERADAIADLATRLSVLPAVIGAGLKEELEKRIHAIKTPSEAEALGSELEALKRVRSPLRSSK